MISRRSLACVLLTVFAGLEVAAQQITCSIRGTVRMSPVRPSRVRSASSRKSYARRWGGW